MSENILAIDVGTQSCRASVVTAGGEIVGIAQIAHEVDSPQPGWAQQRPDDWWDETARAITQVLGETGTAPESIAAVSACGQMHGPVGIDADGNVTTDWVQLWCCNRSAPQCEDLRARSDEEELAQLTGSYINPAWVGLKVRWYKENTPEAYDRARWFLVPKDFINYRLTDLAAADPSEASGTYLWDCQADAYSSKLAEAVGVDLERFAPISASHEVIGEVTTAAAGATGLRAGTPVVVGGGDFPVSMLGFGMVGQGVMGDITGTATLVASHSPKPLIHPGIQNLRHVVDGWIPFTILACGGLSMTWCKDTVSALAGRDVSYDELIEMARQAPPGSDALVFYPYMLGERRRENTTARGGYVGLTLNHSGPHMVRAVMEGVALSMGRDMALLKSRGLDVSKLMCVGGGSRNELWNQIKANVMQMPVELSDQPEAGLKGAALLGAAGAGLIDDVAAAACERRPVSRTVQPQPEQFEQYEQALDEFTRVYDHMLGFWLGR